MGSFIGHVVPGTFFITFGIWWMINIFWRYFSATLNQKHHGKGGKSYKSTISFTQCDLFCLNNRWVPFHQNKYLLVLIFWINNNFSQLYTVTHTNRRQWQGSSIFTQNILRGHILVKLARFCKESLIKVICPIRDLNRRSLDYRSSAIPPIPTWHSHLILPFTSPLVRFRFGLPTGNLVPGRLLVLASCSCNRKVL